jgi:hypothetical protein
VNTWQIIGLVAGGWFVLSIAALVLAMKCFEAGRYAERKKVSENLAEIIRLGVDRVLGQKNEAWSKPMRDALRLKMFETITDVKNTTRH